MTFDELLDYVGFRTRSIRFDLRSIKRNSGWRQRLKEYNTMTDEEFFQFMHCETLKSGDSMELDRAMQARLWAALQKRRNNDAIRG